MKSYSPILAGLLLALSCEKPEPAPPIAAPAKPPKAHLKLISGRVSLKRASGEGWINASGGLPLFENDKVRTASGAKATIDFSNGSTVSLGEDALVSIAETRPRPGLDRSDLTVLRGTVDAQLDESAGQSLTVSTPAATVRAGREIVFQ